MIDNVKGTVKYRKKTRTLTHNSILGHFNTSVTGHYAGVFKWQREIGGALPATFLVHKEKPHKLLNNCADSYRYAEYTDKVHFKKDNFPQVISIPRVFSSLYPKLTQDTSIIFSLLNHVSSALSVVGKGREKVKLPYFKLASL